MLNTPLQTRIENLLVVKIGGSEGLDLAGSIHDLAQLAQQRPVIIVHGVSAVMNALCQARGIPIRTLTSPNGHTSRYTDPETRNVFIEAAEQFNLEVVSRLQARNVNAIGMIKDDLAICGERKDAIRALVNGRIRVIRDDYTGSITSVNTPLLIDVIRAGYTPVLPPIAYHKTDGMLNIDGDRASAAVAGALGAEELVILSNVRGLYRCFPDETSFVPVVKADEISMAMDWAEGRMKRKVLGASEALLSGVRRVVIADGRSESPILRALNGMGTEFVA